MMFTAAFKNTITHDIQLVNIKANCIREAHKIAYALETASFKLIRISGGSI